MDKGASLRETGSREPSPASGLGPSGFDPARGGPFKVLSLFAGIGGFDLGLERTGGFKTVAFCEIESHAQLILRKHWPEAPIYDDVTELTGERLSADGIAVDVICGGFPCQDLSIAGRRAGIADGTRSGLWSEIVRLAGELRPRFLIVENVANLLSGPSEQPGGWFGRVLGDLAELGYDAEWENIPAVAVGAPHRRERVWIVAYAGQADVSEKDHRRQEQVAHHGAGFRTILGAGSSFVAGTEIGAWWQTEPELGRMVHGVSDRLDRIARLGNAVVPQIPELIGRAILAAEAA